jgi:phosphatidylglycerophosphatase A
LKKAPVLAVVLSTWFGCGFFPVAPGTAGSLGALVAVPLWLHFGLAPAWLLVLALMWFPSAVWAAGETARGYQRKDPGLVVIDEVLGQWVTLAGATRLNWKSTLIGFVLFRLFDIWKPGPVRRFESLPGGYGIVADDLAAGVLGALVLYAAGCFNLY